MVQQSTACPHCSASKGECDRMRNDPNYGYRCCDQCHKYDHKGLPN